MSEKRRDNKGRLLRQGELQRADGKYEFRYTDIQASETSQNTEIPLLYRYKNVIASPAHWYWGDKDIMQLWQ